MAKGSSKDMPETATGSLNRRRAALLLALAALLWTGAGGVARGAESAVVFMYHRFGESRQPTTNIRLEQFEAQLAELTSGKYVVKSLAEIVTRLRAGGKLPELTVAISIDDAFLSVYTDSPTCLRRPSFARRSRLREGGSGASASRRQAASSAMGFGCEADDVEGERGRGIPRAIPC